MPTVPIQFSAGYAPGHAIAIADQSGLAGLVSAANPLPVSLLGNAATPINVTASLPTTQALSGTTSVSALLGPFAPVVGRSVILALSGVWSGSVQIVRSTDNGASRLPLTIGGGAWGLYSGNCCEPVWDESDLAARLYLDVSLTSGTLTYRLAQ